MRIIIIAIVFFIVQAFILFNITHKNLPKNQVSINLNANNFSFIKPIDEQNNEEIKEEIKEEIVKKPETTNGIQKTQVEHKLEPKKIAKKHNKKIKQIIKQEEKKELAKENNNEQIKANQQINGEQNANSLNNNSTNGNNDEALALLINQLLNKYKKYPKRAKILNLKGKVIGNFIIKNDDLRINIVNSSHEIFSKETVQTIKKVKNKIPKQAYNTKISFIINYK